MSARGAICITSSVGVASTDRAGYDFPELMKAADAALYEAKERGRDRVVDETLGRQYAPPREARAS